MLKKVFFAPGFCHFSAARQLKSMPAKHDMIINQFCKTVYGGGSNFALLPHNFIFAKKEATDNVRSIFCEVILLQIARAKVIKQTGGSGVFVSPVSYEEKKESIIRTTKRGENLFFTSPNKILLYFFGTFFEADQSVENSQFIGRLQLLLFSEGKDQSCGKKEGHIE